MQRRTRFVCSVLAGVTLAFVAAFTGIAAARRPITGAKTGLATVTIARHIFHLEVASEPSVQDTGLSERDHVDADGGMLFVFADSQYQAFVMRDCSIPIDILYLDEAGRVLSLYSMPPEAPRTARERTDDPCGDAAYNARLKPYPSRAPARFVVELRGGTIERLGVEEGDIADLEVDRLSALAAESERGPDPLLGGVPPAGSPERSSAASPGQRTARSIISRH